MVSGYKGSQPESTFPKLICKKKKKSAASRFPKIEKKQKHTIQHHQTAFHMMLQSTFYGDCVPVLNKSQLVLLMHLQCVLNAKQTTKNLI